MIIRAFVRELKHLQRLSDNARALLVSFFVYSAGWPLITTFCGAYLWRSSGEVEPLLAFNLGLFIGCAFGFYCNALLMQRCSVAVLYGGGLIGLLSAMLLFVMSEVHGIGSSLAGGTIVGGFLGIYWGNRVLLTLNVTQDRERDLFFGIDTMMATVIGIAIPAFFGVLIERQFFLPKIIGHENSYMLILVVVLGAFLVSGVRISRMKFEAARPSPIVCRNKTTLWRCISIVMAMRGFADAVVWFIPVVLPLRVFGGEAGLGGLQSASALLIATTVYFVGRSIQNPRNRITVLACSVVILHIAACLLLFGVTRWSVVTFGLLNGLGTSLSWLGINPIVFRAIEHLENDPAERAGFICHRELSLEVGRVVGSLLLFWGLYLYGDDLFIWCALPAALSQIVLFFAGKSAALEMEMGHTQRPIQG